MTYRKKLIEVALPLEAINVASAREKSIRHGHPSTLHLWWARRPLAACRAVLFGQLVDDPSSWPELFPSEAEQDAERQRLFAVIEAMVPWEASNDEAIIDAARLEIARSLARGRKADGEGTRRDDEVLAQGAKPAVVNKYLAEVAPPVHDPFAGGGSIPLEAQRLGLRAIATDLNPVAVLINKALIEIPSKFAGMPPVNPESRKQTETIKRVWKGAKGLAEDVRYYGKWMRDEAFKRIGHLYPPVKITREMVNAGRPDLKEYGGHELTVIAWLWARTVASPNPAMGGVHVPLVSSFWLSKKAEKEAWIEPVVDPGGRSWRFEVRTGKPKVAKAVDDGTKTGRGQFRCILAGDPIAAAYIQTEGRAGRIRARLMAIVAEGSRSKVYLSPGEQHEVTARVSLPPWTPDFEFVKNSRHMTPWVYGLDTFAKLFTPRQLTALATFSDLVTEAREQVLADARNSGLSEGKGLEAGGTGATAYADALATGVAFCVSRLADRHSSLTRWDPNPSGYAPKIANTFARQALPIVWDFTEGNPFSESSGNFEDAATWVAKVLEAVVVGAKDNRVSQADAAIGVVEAGQQVVISSDPPYYDNVPYADLSDFFYVWLRKGMQDVWPSLFRTLLVPKAAEIVAEPFRHGGKRAAEEFFMSGMTHAVQRMAIAQDRSMPAAIYYAFKQAETGEEGTASTGWEMFLEAALSCGLSVDGTWPLRTELSNRLRGNASNALASSIVLVCRKRPANASSITRSDFRRLLRQELPKAIKALQKGNIAPVDMAQASIGPGMAIFSRHSKVMEADGSSMTVRTALQLINQALDEYQAEQTGEFGPETRCAVTWFETRGFEVGPFGDAETLAKARNVSVSGVAEAGILSSAAGKVRLLKREELPDDWDPATDTRLTVWEGTQHLIKRLDAEGEQGAARLLAKLGSQAEPARDLAYRLYQVCERKGWAEEARAYNSLVVAWPELARLAAQVQPPEPPKPAKPQLELL